MAGLRRSDLSAIDLAPHADRGWRLPADIGPRQPDRLGDSQSGLGEQLEEGPPILRHGGEERRQLIATERPAPGLIRLSRDTDDPHHRRRIGPKRSVLHRGGEQGPQRREVLAHARGRLAEGLQVDDEAAHVARLDLAQPQPLEEGDGVELERAAVVGARRLRQPASGAPAVGVDPLCRVVLEPGATKRPSIAATVDARLPARWRAAHRLCCRLGSGCIRTYLPVAGPGVFAHRRGTYWLPHSTGGVDVRAGPDPLIRLQDWVSEGSRSRRHAELMADQNRTAIGQIRLCRAKFAASRSAEEAPGPKCSECHWQNDICWERKRS